MNRSFDNSRRNVFLSYAWKDKNIAKRIAMELEESGFKTLLSESEILSGESLNVKLERKISSSDYIFILISKNSKKQLINSNFSINYFEELIKRNIVIIPVLLDNSEIPAYFSKFQFFDLRRQTDSRIKKLVKQIGVAPRIDFGSFTAIDFERLVIDLLKKLKFKIKKTKRFRDMGFDFEAEYEREDPFRVKTIESWIVETKFYKMDRASISSLRQLLGSLMVLDYEANALLITTSQLTSTAKNWLNHYSKKYRIRVIEGPELRRLLLSFPDLVDKYFPKRG